MPMSRLGAQAGFSFVVLCALACVAPRARAQSTDAPPPDATAGEATLSVADQQARTLFQDGVTSYAGGRYEEALELFQRAYDLSPHPELLFNIGIAALNGGHQRRALDAFEQFLVQAPESPNRPSVEARIAALRRQVSAEQDAERRAAEMEAAERDRQHAAEQARATTSTAGLGLIIGGGVLVAAGAVLFGVGYADVATVEGAADGTRWNDLSGAYDRAPVLTGIGIGAGALGLAALGVGAVLFATSSGPSETSTTTVAVGPTGITLRGTF